jgi:precorrin-6B methylase 2
MFISIRRYEKVVSAREVCRRIATSFVPLLQKSPGFIAYYAIDCGGGTMATVSIFSTEAMALESNETAAVWMKANVADLQPQPPEIVGGKAEVIVTA